MDNELWLNGLSEGRAAVEEAGQVQPEPHLL